MAVRDLVFTILGIDKASKTFNDVGDSIDKMATRATQIVGVLAGSAAASSVAIVGAVASIPLAFAGIGAFALHETEAVQTAFANLGETLRTDVAADAAPLEDAFVGAAREIGEAYLELRPMMQAAFAASVPAVQSATRAVTGFAREAMPGLLTAVQQSGPVFRALEDVSTDAGRGIGEFFNIISLGAPDAAQGFRAFGDIAQGVLPEIAKLLVQLSGMWAEHGDQVSRVVVRLVDVIEDLGKGALPIVSDAMGVALDVLEGALAVIGPLADQLGPLIGLWLSLSFALKAVGTAQSAITGVTGAVGKLKQGMSEAGGGAGVGRFTAGMQGVMGLLGGPWGIALTVAGVALAMFGRRSADAAEGQRSLASALRESGGEFDNNAKRALMNSKPYQDIAKYVEQAGLSHSEFLDVLVHGGSRLEDLRRRLIDTANANTEYVASGQGATAIMSGQGEAAGRLANALDGLSGIVQGATEDFSREREVVATLHGTMLNAAPGADALKEALKTLRDITADTADRAEALNDAWQRLFGVQLTLDDAVAGFEGKLDDLRESLEVVKDGVTSYDRSMVNARGQIDLTTEKGRDLHSQLEEQGQAYRDLAVTSFDSALKQGKSQAEATAVAAAATNERRLQFLAEMRQMGFNAGQAEALANKYLGMPKDILTTIRADTTQAHQAITKFIQSADGSVIRIRVTAIGDVQALRGSTAIGMAARAGGGPVDPNTWYKVGEEGTELVVPREPGMVLPAQYTSQILNALGRAQRSRPGAAGGVLSPGIMGRGTVAVRSDVTLSYEGLGNADSRIMRELVRGLRAFIDTQHAGDPIRALGR